MLLASCSNDGITEIEQAEIQNFKQEFSLDNFDNKFVKNNIQINWDQMSLDDFYTNIAYLGLEGTMGFNNYMANTTNKDNYSISYGHTRINSTSEPKCD
ncbi:hypothetical protein [Formosa sp. L2A11]|uniref:hypothetical protein n=1 Tax=Formosa sp. L2A11 TaxID=2686363 RepID=UPI00131C43EE|nr:hypothetical protein [Formosa sp. L2A11]